jgi:glycosyltransferase involved in cell wall biosynthesis
MKHKPNVLIIAPNAPPRNTAESIQVRRILAELDARAVGRLITVRPDATGSWAQRDGSLGIQLETFDTKSLALPFHALTNRVLMSHLFAAYHIPDSMLWIRYMAGLIVKDLRKKPEVIYSRSSPMSAALLAHKLKLKLGVPWIMHLSDPWAENPDKILHPRDNAYEAACFHGADLITLTTDGQAEYYRKKYPSFAQKIVVSPNVMPHKDDSRNWLENAPATERDDRLHIVFAGNLYGCRSPEPLIQALDILRETRPELLKKLRIDCYGHAQKTALPFLRQAPDVLTYHGPVSFQEAYNAQHHADIVLTIEANSDNFLIKNTLLSKVTDCLAQGKPMLAITPDGSETARICNEGYGWAVSPARPADIAARIANLIAELPTLRTTAPKAPPPRYLAQTVALDLLAHIATLTGRGAK